MNNTELTLDQLQAISGGQWRDVRDHNYGKFMLKKIVDSFNCDDFLLGGAVRKDIVHPRLQTANVLRQERPGPASVIEELGDGDIE